MSALPEESAHPSLLRGGRDDGGCELYSLYLSLSLSLSLFLSLRTTTSNSWIILSKSYQTTIGSSSQLRRHDLSDVSSIATVVLCVTIVMLIDITSFSISKRSNV